MPDAHDWERYRDRLSAIPSLALNYEPEHVDRHHEVEGWHVDFHEAELPPEPPGPPLSDDHPGAAWSIACDLVRSYAFPDPELITGIFEPDGPLEGRPMLLRARFLVFTFWLPVRVVEVVDETVGGDQGPERAWGYSYTTLEGHFEKGQIWFTVVKQEQTGRVLFRIRAVSHPDRIRNPLYRIGFALFGRRLQLRFAHTAMERMQRLTAERLAARAAGVPAKPESGPDVATLEPTHNIESATAEIDLDDDRS